MNRTDLHASLTTILTEGNAPGGTIEEFDLEAILDDIYKATGGYSLVGMDDEVFWGIVRRHDSTQGEQSNGS